MPNPIKAGIVYSLLVFLAAAMLGSVRLTLLVPLFGTTTAVLIELPIVLAISWNLCGIVLRHFPVVRSLGPRLAMGASALLFIFLEEMALATLVFGQTVAGFLNQYSAVPELIGLAGQIVFALIPFARLAVPRSAGD